MSKHSRNGGKFSGSHTTCIPAAAIIADIAHECTAVTKISVGFIKSGLPNTKGQRRVKITLGEGSLLLSVRDNISIQELRVYATDVQLAKQFIASSAHKAGFLIAGQP